MVNYLNYSDPLIIVWRKGDASDPYSDKSESWKVINNVVTLAEIPDEFNHVVISGYTEVRSEDVSIPASNQFIVNYQNGMITFNASENGKTISAQYKGKGIILYPASRIYVETDVPNIFKTLQEVVNNSQGIADALKNLTEVLASAKLTKSELETDITVGNALKTSLGSIISDANSIKMELSKLLADVAPAKSLIDASVTTANTLKTALDESITSAGAKKNDLEGSITTGSALKLALDTAITDGGALKTGLDGDLSQGNKLKVDLDTLINTATTQKTDLDTVITTATNKKIALDESVKSSEASKNSLDASVASAAAAKAGIDSSVSAASTLKTNLDASISTGATLKTGLDGTVTNAVAINTTLNGSVIAGQNKIEQVDSKLGEMTTAINNTNSAIGNSNDVAVRLSVFENFSGTKVYYPLNKVAYSGSSYVCIKETTAGTLPSNQIFWTMIAQAGSGNVSSVNGDGTGDLIVANPTSAVQIALNTGIGANKIVKQDSSGKVTADILKDGDTNLVVTSMDKTKWDRIADSVSKTSLAVPNGVATLGSDGLVPVSQLPKISSLTVVNTNEEFEALKPQAHSVGDAVMVKNFINRLDVPKILSSTVVTGSGSQYIPAGTSTFYVEGLNSDGKTSGVTAAYAIPQGSNPTPSSSYTLQMTISIPANVVTIKVYVKYGSITKTFSLSGVNSIPVTPNTQYIFDPTVGSWTTGFTGSTLPTSNTVQPPETTIFTWNGNLFIQDVTKTKVAASLGYYPAQTYIVDSMTVLNNIKGLNNGDRGYVKKISSSSTYTTLTSDLKAYFTVKNDRGGFNSDIKFAILTTTDLGESAPVYVDIAIPSGGYSNARVDINFSGHKLLSRAKNVTVLRSTDGGVLWYLVKSSPIILGQWVTTDSGFATANLTKTFTANASDLYVKQSTFTYDSTIQSWIRDSNTSRVINVFLPSDLPSISSVSNIGDIGVVYASSQEVQIPKPLATVSNITLSRDANIVSSIGTGSTMDLHFAFTAFTDVGETDATFVKIPKADLPSGSGNIIATINVSDIYPSGSYGIRVYATVTSSEVTPSNSNFKLAGVLTGGYDSFIYNFSWKGNESPPTVNTAYKNKYSSMYYFDGALHQKAYSLSPTELSNVMSSGNFQFKNNIYIGTTAPLNPTPNMIWIDTTY
ncbi:hypothetical protein GK047_19690 [Paenibacillus sp. SYP-B3998]|uniref:Uncharacterized protein n=1 Tax=Paenibacillus sp. SYP-B3998 TaxID=2678564 RepID=A0A6G4A3K0_9BACL|nr:hypothetical protein [Paenibacillus sp. SYP-B3998]NEW08227.1 hypothetical protein [Paenibacillus sp. SYP-B3998]